MPEEYKANGEPGSTPERALPTNIEAEQALLGALLLNNDVADKIPGLDPEHFHDQVHARIYEVARRRIAAGKIASPVTMKLIVANDEGLRDLGGVDYLARLAGAAVSLKSAPDYAEAIVDAARRRRQITALTEAADELTSAENPADVIARLEGNLAGDDAQDDRGAGVSLHGAMATAIDGMNEAFRDGDPPGTSLCIPALERTTGKAQRGDYMLLAGRPSMGKSAIAIEIARRAAQAGTGIVYWCAEMFPEENAARMLSAGLRDRHVNLAYRDARAGRMSEIEFRAIIEEARDRENLPVHFIDPAITDLQRLQHEFRRHARRMQRQGRDVLLVADYLQKIRVKGADRPYERVSAASGGLKQVAMQIGAPILVLSQLSRAVEQRDNKRPVLSDLRDSGEIEQDANTAIFAYRDEYYLERLLEADPDSKDAENIRTALGRARGRLDLLVAKQRSGPVRTVTVGFDGATNSLWEIDDRVVSFPENGREEFDL